MDCISWPRVDLIRRSRNQPVGRVASNNDVIVAGANGDIRINVIGGGAGANELIAATGKAAAIDDIFVCTGRVGPIEVNGAWIDTRHSQVGYGFRRRGKSGII